LICASGQELGGEVDPVDDIPTLDALRTLFEGSNQLGALRGIEVLVIESEELDLRTLRELSGFVQEKSPAPDVCF
jgi:hypothetical protein